MLRNLGSSIGIHNHTSNLRGRDTRDTTSLQLIAADGMKTVLKNTPFIGVTDVTPGEVALPESCTQAHHLEHGCSFAWQLRKLQDGDNISSKIIDTGPPQVEVIKPGPTAGSCQSGCFNIGSQLEVSDTQVQHFCDVSFKSKTPQVSQECRQSDTDPERKIKRRIYSDDEWDSMKPILHMLYIEDSLCLERVMSIMSKEHNFHPTIKMYKSRLLKWKWRKNKSKKSEAVVTVTSTLGTRRTRRDGDLNITRIPRIRSPDNLRTQELSFYTSKLYTRAQFDSHGWTHGPFTINSRNHEAGSNGRVDFFSLETLSIYAMHQMKRGNFVSAYESLNAIFDGMHGIWGTLHPKLLVGFWLLFRKVYDICIIARDAHFELLRVFMRYHGYSAKQYLNEDYPGSLNPLPRLIMVLVEMSKLEPGLIERVFRYCSIAAADSLEEKIGLDHPTVLLAWGNNFWYWKVPVLVSKDLKVRFESLLARAAAKHDPASPLFIGILYDYALVIYHSNKYPEDERRLVRDLLSGTAVHVRAGIPSERSQVTRAHASGTVLACIHALEDGDLALCETISQEAIDWLASGGHFMKMYAEMVQADRETLIDGWREKKELRGLFLNFVRPRCIDMERETLES